MKTNAFSFVELIVSMTILVILSGIGFTSYTSYLGDSRDSQRKSDLAQIGSALKVYKQKRGYYPIPGNNFNVTYDSNIVAYQGFFDSNVRLNTLDKLVLDPRTQKPYFYSIVKNKQEYEMAATLENEEEPISLLHGTYKSASKNILPTILLATKKNPGENAEIMAGLGEGDENRKKFIFNNQNHNIPYEFIEPFNPLSDGTDLSTILSELSLTNSYWQNTDYRNCLEIEEAGKDIIPFSATAFEYQIITSTGALTDTLCTQ